ncbi:unnamed protein product, partial [Strongylus vulgaris]
MLAELDQMLYLFLDDIHLLKYGPFMSTIEKRVRQLTGSNRSIIVAEVLLDEVLLRRNGVMTGGIQGPGTGSVHPFLSCSRASSNYPELLILPGNMDALKEMALCQFEFIDSAVRSC